MAQRKEFPHLKKKKKKNEDMLGICVLMNLTLAVISQERASLSGLKEKTFKNVPTSSSTLFGVLVEDHKNLHEFGEDLTGFEECTIAKHP